MEILSTGEKIKRERIYKSFTLKDLCSNKVSVSKMSCIENGKIKVEPDLLQYISEKLDINYEYLKQDIPDQIRYYINNINKYFDKNNYESQLKYLLQYAEEHKSYDNSFKIYHLMFEHYMEKEDYDSIENILFSYFKNCLENDIPENDLIFSMDLASYYTEIHEYDESNKRLLTCKELLKNDDLKKVYYEKYLKILINQINNYIRNEDERSILQFKEELLEISKMEDSVWLRNVNYFLCIIDLIEDKEIDSHRKSIIEEHYKADYEFERISKETFAEIMLKHGRISEANDILNSLILSLNKDERENYVKHVLKYIYLKLKYNCDENLSALCDEILNIAIEINNIEYIEKAYFYKSLILEHEGNIFLAEMYLNLSLDALQKFGTEKQLVERYIKIGELYNKMNNMQESLKYFNLALQSDEIFFN
ncbi:MAG: helix-turn-helix domain-containing protein [Oscillospiraceae bacterium]|nr:helix-turn-helix domain-containing protein [Oscillospiraceae bacterium]